MQRFQFSKLRPSLIKWPIPLSPSVLPLVCFNVDLLRGKSRQTGVRKDKWHWTWLQLSWRNQNQCLFFIKHLHTLLKCQSFLVTLNSFLLHFISFLISEARKLVKMGIQHFTITHWFLSYMYGLYMRGFNALFRRFSRLLPQPEESPIAQSIL